MLTTVFAFQHLLELVTFLFLFVMQGLSTWAPWAGPVTIGHERNFMSAFHGNHTTPHKIAHEIQKV